MRRKLFLFAMVIVFAVSWANYAGMLPAGEIPPALCGQELEYRAFVRAIDKFDEERTALKVEITHAGGERLAQSFFALVTCFREGEEGAAAQPWRLWRGELVFRCELEKPSPARNPGCFDYARHLLSEGVIACAYVDDFGLRKEADGRLALLEKKLIESKYRFAASLPEEARGLVMGVLFGETAFLPDDVYESFRINGTAHVLSVSGLHVGLLYSWISRAAGRRRSPFFLLGNGGCLILYCFLSSFSASALRAAAMIMLSLLAACLDRRYDMLSAASFVALLFMASDAHIIFNAGFQMSFVAVAAIAFFYRRMPKKLPDSLAISLAANLGLIPYQLYVFNWFSLSSFIANVPVVYLTGIIVPFGLLYFIVFCFCGPVELPAFFLSAFSQATIRLNDFLTFGRGGFDVVSPPLWLVLALCLLLFFLSSEQCELWRLRAKRRCLAVSAGGLLALALILGSLPPTPLAGCELVFVDVGQGDCLHIRSGDTNVLIDGGGDADYNVGAGTLKPYLLKNGVRRIDLALATHRHTDHFRGLYELEEEGLAPSPLTGLTAGQSYEPCEGLKIEVLWPLSLAEDPLQEENSSCSVFMVNFRGCRVLVTGDLDAAGEKSMVAHYRGTDRLRADILKIGHHGSAGSTSDELLAAVKPAYAVIQVGKNNYGHPAAIIIEKCRQKCIMILRNDIQGAVGFSLQKGKLTPQVMIESN